jgi:hypothetical protein
MMKKLTLLLITITTFTNVSYASFPVDTNKTDTTQVAVKETTEQYHLRMEQQGFDISNCMCTDCRKFKGSNTEGTDLHPDEKAKINIMFLGAAMLIGLVTIGVYVDWDNFPPIFIPLILTVFLIFYLKIILNNMKEKQQLNNS